MSSNDSIYNDQHVFDVSSVPSWKSPPLHGAYAPNAKLTPRMKAGIGAGVVVLAGCGMFAWSNYATSEANAEVRKAQIAVNASQVELQRQAQAAALAKSAGQETDAQKARREAVEACVAKANGFNAVADCGNAFPVDSPGMGNTAQTVGGSGKGSGPTSDVGLIVIGSLGAALTVGWAKKRLARA